MPIEIPFVSETFESRSIDQNQQKLINMFPVEDNSGGKKSFSLYPTPGLLDFGEVIGASEGRGIIEHKGVIYAVVDSNFYSVGSDGTFTQQGTLSTSTGYVSMAATQDEIMLVDGTAGYTYIISTDTFATITDTDFPDTTTNVTSIDGYFIVPVPDTDQFQLSALLDGQTWAATDVATAEGNPDNLTAVFSLNRQLWLFGERSTEVWFNSGASFPFERIEGSFAEFGLAAKHSVSKIKDTVIWLSQTQAGGVEVVLADGFVTIPVTSRAVAYQISTYTTINDAEAFVYKDEGHEFYVLTFPTEAKTWVYDLTTGKWHERQSSSSRYIPRVYASAYNKHLGLAYNSGNLYEIDMDTYTEDGTAITRTARTAPLHQTGNFVSVYTLRLDLEKAQGAVSGTETITLKTSRDGGHNFDSGDAIAASRNGEYADRVIWRMLGQSRSWVFEFTTTDSIKWILLGLEADVDIGDV